MLVFSDQLCELLPLLSGYSSSPPPLPCVNKYTVLAVYGPYDLIGPVCNAFDAGNIHDEGKWEGGGFLTFLDPVKRHRAVRQMPFGVYIVNLSMVSVFRI